MIQCAHAVCEVMDGPEWLVRICKLMNVCNV